MRCLAGDSAGLCPVRGPLAARHRKWNTGKANFIVLDQFNTAVYSYEDRYRGVYGTRKVLLMKERTWRG
jgi:hypothetical protein